jgi:hypothetical protein
MWLFTKNSFVSIVQHRERPDDVLVRARAKRHLERLFPHKVEEIYADHDADYTYRLLISKHELADVISAHILERLDYDNFKAAQEKDDPAWKYFLNAVWAEGLKLQK